MDLVVPADPKVELKKIKKLNKQKWYQKIWIRNLKKKSGQVDIRGRIETVQFPGLC